jgi:hypothetical protein
MFLEQVRLTDAAGNVITPASQPAQFTSEPPTASPAGAVRTAPGSVDANIVLLRRIVKLLETQAAADAAQRQRVTLDAISGSLVLGTVTTVSTVTNMSQLAGYDQRMFSDFARQAYNGMRSQITFR